MLSVDTLQQRWVAFATTEVGDLTPVNKK